MVTFGGGSGLNIQAQPNERTKICPYIIIIIPRALATDTPTRILGGGGGGG